MEGISYHSVQAAPFEYGSLQAISFEGTTCICLQLLSVWDIFYCSHQAVSLNNIQPVCFVHSSYECDCFLSAYWYLGDLVVQIIEATMKAVQDNLKFYVKIRVFLPKCLCKNKGQPRSLRLYLFRLYRRTSLMIGIL